MSVWAMSCRLLHRMQHQLLPAQGKKRQMQLDSRRVTWHRLTIPPGDLCMALLIIIIFIAAQHLVQAASKGLLGYIYANRLQHCLIAAPYMACLRRRLQHQAPRRRRRA